MKYAVIAALALMVVPTAVAQADNTAAATTNRGPASTRSKDIKFEDDVVEGMNKNPMDSAENLGRHDGGNNTHLYHKPTDFKDAVRQTVHEMGKTQ